MQFICIKTIVFIISKIVPIYEHIYLGNKIIEYSDGSFLATKMVEGEIVSNKTLSLLRAKNFIDEKPLKLYEVKVNFVRYYSGVVLVEAHGAAEAREKVLDDWENTDTIYDKVTFSPDHDKLSLPNIKAVKEEDAMEFSDYDAILRAEE